ncbi:MAG: NRDE family protein [Gemmatimonadetes bacterium]|nr:NRDE family protein [Gemmatimonadota bacterium]
MCTLIAFHHVFDDALLIVATNRDEAYARPASPPAWGGDRPRFLAPRDDEAGGTWMGANETGLWIGLTNAEHCPIERDRRSRGLLCRDLLSCASSSEVVAQLTRLDHRYNAFNLLTIDADGGYLAEYADGRATARPLETGCRIVTNRAIDDTASEPKVKRAIELLGAAGLWDLPAGSPAPESLVSTLALILGDHGHSGDDALCLHGERYGTRSAAVWRVGSPGTGGSIELSYADGAPCSTPFVEVQRGGATQSANR